MKRKWIIAFAACAVLLLAWLFFPKSDEEKIRDVFDEMAEGFSDGHPGPATSGIGEELIYRREHHPRDLLIGYLFQFFQRNKREGGGPRYEAEVSSEETTVTVKEQSADALVAVRFNDRMEDTTKPNSVQFSLRLQLIDDEWKIVELLEVKSSPPFRH